MQNPESLKRSIRSAEDLAGVVRTMKTMAAVSIRQYETAVRSLELYSETVETGLAMLLRSSHSAAENLKAETDRTGCIVFGSDQGMCGQFNEQIAEYCAERFEEYNLLDVPPLCIGHRIADKLAAFQWSPEKILRIPGSAVGITGFVHELLTVIDSWRKTFAVGRILVFHNHRQVGSAWQPSAQQLLPLRPDRFVDRETKIESGRSLPVWTMPTPSLFSRLVRQFLFVSLFRACAESLASENASRITAMQSAERNIDERLHRLRAEYAQQRQTAITEELLDVVTGFEALRQAAEQQSAEQHDSEQQVHTQASVAEQPATASSDADG